MIRPIAPLEETLTIKRPPGSGKNPSRRAWEARRRGGQSLELLAAFRIAPEFDPLVISGVAVPGSAGPISGMPVREAGPARAAGCGGRSRG
jgi:hypothetical protein